MTEYVIAVVKIGLIPMNLVSEITYEPISTKKELSCIKRYQKKRDGEALRILIEANIPYIIRQSLAYHRAMTRSVEVEIITREDVVQEGCLGFISAVAKFDPARDCNLRSYADWWIYCYVSRANSKHLIHIAVHALNPIDKYYKRALKQTKSCDVPDEVLDAIVAPRSLPHDSKTAELRRKFLQLSFCLTAKERSIINYRFDGMTLEEVGEKCGYTRERIRQIQSDAFHKIRRLDASITRQANYRSFVPQMSDGTTSSAVGFTLL